MLARLKLRSMVLLLALFCNHKSFCMELFKKVQKKYHDYQAQRDIDAAFKALARNDYKKLAALSKADKVFPYSENKEGVTLFGQLLRTQNHRALLPVVHGLLQDHGLNDIPRIRSWLRNGPIASVERPEDDKPLYPAEIVSYAFCLGIIFPSVKFFDVLHIYDDLPEFINQPLKNDEIGVDVMPYLHECMYLYSCAYEEKKNKDTKHTSQIVFPFLLPHLSPRAFESITDYAELPERDLPKTTALINGQHAEWKAMSAQRNALVKSHIYPCENIVREYLEDNEYQWIEYFLSEQYGLHWWPGIFKA